MATLYFTRQFTKGNLKGLTHNDTISFPPLEACADWVKVINSPKKQRTLDYKIVDKSFQKYWRY